jgi:hypothetical protein
MAKGTATFHRPSRRSDNSRVSPCFLATSPTASTSGSRLQFPNGRRLREAEWTPTDDGSSV